MTDLKKQIAALQDRHAALTAEREGLNPWKDSVREEALGAALKTLENQIRTATERDVAISAGLPDPHKEPAKRSSAPSTTTRLPRLPKAKTSDAAEFEKAMEKSPDEWQKLAPSLSPEQIREVFHARQTRIITLWNKASDEMADPLLALREILIVYDSMIQRDFFFAREKRVELERRVEELEARPSLHDAGVYEAGTAYSRGAAVSHSGSYWVAKADTTLRPGESTDWRLIVKKGSNGKDADPRAVAERLLPEVEAAIAKHMKG
jgi:hypothetical protein